MDRKEAEREANNKGQFQVMALVQLLFYHTLTEFSSGCDSCAVIAVQSSAWGQL